MILFTKGLSRAQKRLFGGTNKGKVDQLKCSPLFKTFSSILQRFITVP